jgi:hypothetical protein
MATKNWKTLSEDYRGQWVALMDDETTVIAHDKVVAKVIKQAAEQGYENPILYRVPSSPMPYVA